MIALFGHALSPYGADYQGVLKFTGCCPGPAFFHIRFALYDVETNGAPLPVLTNIVPVETNGLFHTALNLDNNRQMWPTSLANGSIWELVCERTATPGRLPCSARGYLAVGWGLSWCLRSPNSTAQMRWNSAAN